MLFPICQITDKSNLNVKSSCVRLKFESFNQGKKKFYPLLTNGISFLINN